MLDELEHELERVRAYRADVPEPDDAAVAEARLLLMRAIAHEPRTAAPQRGRSGQAFFVSLFRYDVRNSQRSGRGRGLRPVRSRERLRRLQRRRRFALAGGLATVGVGVAGVLGLTTATTPVSALAARMNQLAKVAASQAWTGIPGPGQYLYVDAVSSEPGYTKGPDGQKCWVSLIEHRQEWIATDGSGAWSDVQHGAYTSAADKATCATMDDSAAGNGASEQNRLGPGELSFPTNDWHELSTDPRTLLEQIRALGPSFDGPAGEFRELTRLMTESDIPPALRATVYDALALIPGVKLLGQQTDPVGQSGLEVEYAGGSSPRLIVGRTDLIFDQQTGSLIFEDDYSGAGALGQAGLWTAYTAEKIVDTLPNYPLVQGNVSRTPPPQLAPVPGLSETTTTAETTPSQASTTTTPAPGTTTPGATTPGATTPGTTTAS